MASPFLGQKHQRFELILDGVSYELWDHEDVTAGSETQTGTDANDGPFIAGGPQTHEEVTISRHWKKGREAAIYKTLKTGRGRLSGQALLHEIDPDTDQPTSAEPLDTLEVVLKTVVKPGGERGGTDLVKIQATLTVQA